MKWLWPIRTGRTVFDVWFVIHLCFWVFASSNMAAFHLPLATAIVIMAGVALSWELFERYAERRWPDIWRHPEAPVNSYLGDVVLAGGLGTWVGYFLVGAQ